MQNLSAYIKANYKHRVPVHKRNEENQQEETGAPVPLEDSTNTEILPVGHSVVDILRPNLENNFNSTQNNSMQLAEVVTSNEVKKIYQVEYKSEKPGKINGTVVVLMVMIYIYGIAMVAAGSIYYTDCPAEPMIPLSLIVIGGLMLASRLLSIPEECRSVHYKKRIGKANIFTWCRLVFNALIQIVIIIFLILLSYWVFSLNPDDNKHSPFYCEDGFYKQVYVGLILADIFLGIAFVGVVCLFAVNIKKA